MMNNEEYIKKRIGKGNPFKVPDGYFASFTSDIMSRLPEQNQMSALDIVAGEKKKRDRFRTVLVRYAVAACLCGVAFSAAFYFSSRDEDVRVQPELYSTNANESMFEEEILDYAMMDNTDIYACLLSGSDDE